MSNWVNIVWLVLCLMLPFVAQAEQTSAGSSGEQGSAGVIQAFTTDKSEKSEIVSIEDDTKRLVMFVMGVPLLLLIIATVALGVAMGVYGKPVFVPHMVCAGLSLTLALGHAVVGIVWFYPF
ncbi:MAG TPA: hypothetical protein ENI97_05255 [Gammaproteobacteria bacterium]|nr:hypothetical protein [Gammaproteobacteria bacterium]